ncbi:MAG TPA: hypothetical protein VE987_15015, partial [Polyangiaceae bacterium]|nr:hypothetical protein [Polyangiaceae bacterium]
FDADAIETLRLAGSPVSVVSGGAPLAERADLDDAGYTITPTASGAPVVRVRHRGRGEVAVTYVPARASRHSRASQRAAQ